MNPTEHFIKELCALLEKHQSETGTYIEMVRINRDLLRNSEDVRAKRLIVEIELEIK